MPGFWLGLWHGLTSVFSLVAELFGGAGIYAVPNSGSAYDIGFLLGILSLAGAAAYCGNLADHRSLSRYMTHWLADRESEIERERRFLRDIAKCDNIEDIRRMLDNRALGE
jgi:hypothetical protein